MKYAIQVAPTDETMPIADIARAAEDRGFDSLWVPEHTHIPVEHQSRYPGSPDGAIPDVFYRLYDPFIALATAAAVTENLKIGTAVCLVSHHEAIALAKRASSLDSISGGRFIFGIGAGWFREEMEPFGTRYETRWKLTEERIRACRALWADESAEFHGEFVDFPKLVVKPKPASQPSLPVYIGAGSRWTPQRVVDWADGWLPQGFDVAAIEEGMAKIRELAPAAGRDPDSIPTTVFNASPDLISDYERLGAERAIFVVPRVGADQILAEIDKLAKLIPAGASAR